MKKILILTCLSIIINGFMFSQTNNDSTFCTKHDTAVKTVVEKIATFQGGDLNAFRNYLATNLIYPAEATMKKYKGRVLVKFVVDWDGIVKNSSILLSSGYKVLDDEAIRVVSYSPKWSPAKDKGICVPQQFVVPIDFKIK
jgi:protein TonB